jgi:hypothetical protein
MFHKIMFHGYKEIRPLSSVSAVGSLFCLKFHFLNASIGESCDAFQAG